MSKQYRNAKGQFAKRHTRPAGPVIQKSWGHYLGWGVFWLIVFFPVSFYYFWKAWTTYRLMHPFRAHQPVRSAPQPAGSAPQSASKPTGSAAPVPSFSLTVETSDPVSPARTDLPDGSARYDYTGVAITQDPAFPQPPAGTALPVEPLDSTSVRIGRIGVLKGRRGEMAADYLRLNYSITCAMGQAPGTVDLVFVRPPRSPKTAKSTGQE